MPNRLASESSPYLLQHKDNPVDWYPWGEKAFDRARVEDKPVFLSVGYSSCHWCHVMEHESFEDGEVASALNRDFVSVKVDREERPDVDEAYMAAVQLSSGRGGWPMSVFMTPDRKPFLAATYFPKNDRQGQPGFLTILRSIASAWKDKRAGLIKAADEFATALEETSRREAPPSSAELNEALLERAVAVLGQDFDQAHGGFGDKPKFPPHTAVEFLMAYAIRDETSPEMRELAVAMSLITLEKICLGGIHDHVGGGFHRYSTDERWLLPHFEKMLYDNALMLSNLAWGARIAMQLDQRLASLFIRSADRLVEWLDREMRSPEGLFYSAIDADSDGEEGKFYVWTESEIREALGERANAFCRAYGIRAEGNFHDEATGKLTGANILFLMDDDGGAFEKELDALLTDRWRRIRVGDPTPHPLPPLPAIHRGEGVSDTPPPAPSPRTNHRGDGVPGLDYKALVGWNGLMILALAEAGAMPLAEAAADAILKVEAGTGRLPRQVTPSPSPDGEGAGGGEGFLDDYAYFTLSLLRLAEAGDRQGKQPSIDRGSPYFAPAARICGAMVERFYDDPGGGFFYTSDRHEPLFGRTKPVFDQPLPSATSVAVRCLILLGDYDRARRTLESCLGWMERAPGSTEGLLVAALQLLDTNVATSAYVAAAGTIQPAPSSVADGTSAGRGADGTSALREIAVSLSSRELRLGPDGWARGEVVIDIPEGLHINTNNPPARWLTPTSVEIEGVEHEVEYPEGTDFRYDGRTAIPFRVKPPSGKSPAEFQITVRFQACTESECLAPVERTFDGVALLARKL